MHEFRKATAGDANAIADLYRELLPTAPISVLPERITEIQNDKNTYLIVCEANGNIIATAFVTLCADAMFNRQPFAIIENVIVSKDHQRNGIGKSLVDHIEAFCIAEDCSKIMLLSSSNNRTAQDFYTAMGYDSDTKSGFIKKRSYLNH